MSDEQFQNAVKILRELGKDNSDVLEWVVNPSLDSRKGRIIVEDAVFADKETFERFRTSDKHNEVAAIMREIADWWVGDYEL